MKVTIYTDGAARGNPGPAAAGAIIRDEHNKIIAQVSHRIGFATNNQAEYIAIVMALEEALKLGATNVNLKSDSELVVKQLGGRYRVKNVALKPLYQKVIKLSSSLESFKINHIPRGQNEEADKLANRALDG